MNERDALSFCADPRYFVDQTDGGGSTPSECCIDIRYDETHVMQAWAASGDELPDRGLGVQWLEQLDECVAGREAFNSSAVGVVERYDRQPEHITVEW